MSKRALVIVVVLAGLTLALTFAACSGAPGAGSTATSNLVEPTLPASTVSTASTTSTIIAPEDLKPVVQPTLPKHVPASFTVDPATGLHVTGTPTVVDIATYRLKVTGKVDHELSLSYDDLRLLPRVTASPELVCPEEFSDEASWTGVPLKLILEMAGPKADATEVILKGADNYISALYLKDAVAPQNFLAYELNGQTLPVLHGFPLRAVFPGQPGNLWTKWLTEIQLQ